MVVYCTWSYRSACHSHADFALYHKGGRMGSDDPVPIDRGDRKRRQEARQAKTEGNGISAEAANSKVKVFGGKAEERQVKSRSGQESPFRHSIKNEVKQ